MRREKGGPENFCLTKKKKKKKKILAYLKATDINCVKHKI